MIWSDHIKRYLWVGVALALCLVVSSPAFGLLLGAVASFVLGAQARAVAQRASKLLLKLAVICLGAGLQLAVILEVGYQSLGVTFASIALTLIIGALLGRWLSVDSKVTTLISGGTAICGGSAIAALSPSISASQAQTAAAMLIVFSLNALGLLIFPPLGEWLALSEAQFGLWAALAIHDTSSVVGAATIFGGAAVAIGTTVKLTRALWILPLSLISARLHRATSGAKIPWFLFGFLGIACLRALSGDAPEVTAVFDGVSLCGKRLMVSTLFLIGAGLKAHELRSLGARPLLMALTLWVLVSAASLWIILSGWIVTPRL